MGHSHQGLWTFSALGNRQGVGQPVGFVTTPKLSPAFGNILLPNIRLNNSSLLVKHIQGL